MIEFILGVISNVLSNYVTALLTRRHTERNRAELVMMIQKEILASGRLRNDVEVVPLVVRELDLIVEKDSHLAWQNDRLIIRPTGRIRKTLPSQQDVLDELRVNIAERRRELGLPLTSEDAIAMRGGGPEEGELVPLDPDQAGSTRVKRDFRAEILNLPTEVLRERERRRRESAND